MTMYNYKTAKERNNDTRLINTVSAIQTIIVSTPFVCMVCFIIIQLTMRIKRSRNEERWCRDELTDTLALQGFIQKLLFGVEGGVALSRTFAPHEYIMCSYTLT